MSRDCKIKLRRRSPSKPGKDFSRIVRIREFVDIERNGNSFRVHVKHRHVERKRDAKKENESNVESRRASSHGTHVSIFDISICERARVSACLWDDAGYTRCTSLPIALNHDLHHGCRYDSADFCPPSCSRSAEIGLVIPRLLLPNPYRLIFKYTFYTFFLANFSVSLFSPCLLYTS